MHLEEYKPVIVIIMVQFVYAGVTLTTRAALVQGMNSSVFVVYRHSIAFLCLVPIAYYKRDKEKCRMGWKSFCLIFFISLVGVTGFQMLYFEGLRLSSSAASALFELVPAITFLMAHILGLEKLNPRSLASMAKIVGTTICVTGAIVMTLLKGPKLSNTSLLVGDGSKTYLLGCLSFFGSACCFSFWLIVQVHVHGVYPDHVSLTAWMCLMTAIQSAIITLSLDHNLQAWQLDSNIQILCCLYAGFAAAFTTFSQSWCVEKGGPVFSAMFHPLCTVIVIISACIFLHEAMYIGSLLGVLAVIVGLYIVLWGKSKDNDAMKQMKASQTKKPTDKANEDSEEPSYRMDLEEPLLAVD